jgi:imidazolonepropionase-like amidohydrolase
VPTHVTREEDARATDPAFSGDDRFAYLDPLSRWAWRDDLSGTRSRYPLEAGSRALRAYFDHGLRLTGEAHAAGVGILVGTDTVLGGFRYHDEMAHLVRAGLTPAEVLRAATLDAARYAGEEFSSGSVTVGKRADLVLLDANPLEDIANTRRIRAVVQGGRLYDRGRIDALLAFVRDEAEAPHNWAKLLWGFARSSVRGEL